MSYVDAFVAAVSTAKKEDYRKHAEKTAPLFAKYGALKVVECWGDDIPDGELTSFPLAVKMKDGETVVCSWVLWPSKEVRDEAWQKLMEDPAMKAEDMPFEGKRMIYGGFELMLET